MVAIRKTNPVLSEGSYQFLPTGNKAVLANLRQSEGAAILAIHNLTDQDQTATLDLSAFAGTSPRDLLERLSGSLPEISTAPYSVSLKPFDYYWLKIE
jgi:maltose alpha-D-glucosyltransferase/alpha-amylase